MFKKGLIIGFAAVIAMTIAAYAIQVGGVLPNVKIKNTSKADAWIPGIGSKVVTIFYNDVDVKDVNDALSNAIKAKNYPKAKYLGVGIANCKDAPFKPDYFITNAADSKQKQFPDSVILLDYDLSIKNAWALPETNEVSWVIVVGRDKKIKFMKGVKSAAESQSLINVITPIIEAELKK
ncbi:MAG: hypothetical protein MUD12_02135 [Spirochaetes bacterium]|jgi:predicted transcriptional regulator|nr:hypothetical protein [Spirochaetota bacterium]